jgi:hypothetical protein
MLIAILLFFSWLSLSSCQPNFPTNTPSVVPLPSESDFLRTFLNLIKESRYSEAVDLLEDQKNFSPETRQAWLTQFQNWNIQQITRITPDADKFRVEWTNSSGGDTKWVTVVKNGQKYQIKDIATGP